MESALQFLQSIRTTSSLVHGAVLHENSDLLHLHLPDLIGQSVLIRKLKTHFQHGDLYTSLSCILNHLKLLILSAHNYLLNVADNNLNNGVTLEVTHNNEMGRPRIKLPIHQIVALRTSQMSWEKISKVLNVSRKTLFNVRRQYNLPLSKPQTNISDQNLIDHIASIKAEYPRAGFKYIWAALKARHIFVTWQRLLKLVRLLDPVGVFMRRHKRLKRRNYKVKGSNYLWSIDANEKLVGWNLYIHGCIDVHSRKVIYLRLAVCKRADVVQNIFQQGVKECGIPMRVRSDYGTENTGIHEFMMMNRPTVQSPFILGKSVHNTRIERLWGEVNRVVSFKFRQIFRELMDAGVMDQHSYLDLLCLCYIFFPRIQNNLTTFKELYNLHGLRTERNTPPNQLWLTSLIEQSYERDIVAEGLVPDYIDFRRSEIDHAPPNFLIEPMTFNLDPVLIDTFNAIATETIPNPLLDDGNAGKSLYLSLKNHLESI